MGLTFEFNTGWFVLVNFAFAVESSRHLTNIVPCDVSGYSFYGAILHYLSSSAVRWLCDEYSHFTMAVGPLSFITTFYPNTLMLNTLAARGFVPTTAVKSLNSTGVEFRRPG